jgi:NAD(P)-dependent dehydrogenase (short-subunit alcohol dehydrogenase family)
VCCDVQVPADVKRLADIAARAGDGRVAALVNNAGLTSRMAFKESDLAGWQQLQSVNVNSVYALTHALIEPLSAARGAVVSVASVAGLVGVEGLTAYSATKAAIIALTRSLALELGDTVRFNAVCPGDIATRMMQRTVNDPGLHAASVARIPAGRFGRPDEVANVIVWLLSEDASYVNGVAIPVDGGLSGGYRDPVIPAGATRSATDRPARAGPAARAVATPARSPGGGAPRAPARSAGEMTF